MLLKDSEGDVGICVANWVGFRPKNSRVVGGNY
jgi:hypothetical protein